MAHNIRNSPRQKTDNSKDILFRTQKLGINGKISMEQNCTFPLQNHRVQKS